MQKLESLEAVHTHTHTHTHTSILEKINKIVHKISIMLFSNVLFLRIYKHVQKIIYC